MDDSRLLNFTIFPRLSATVAVAQALSFPQLVAKIQTPREFPNKASMPLLVMWQCGDSRTDMNCLRYDGNVRALCGIATDYDRGELSLPDAATMLADARLTAILYTSPSSTPERPRWRAILPTAADVEPSQHRTLVGRANAALGGVLAIESFRVSQSYFVGRAQTAAHYETALVNGDRCVDEATDLAPVIPATAAVAIAAATAVDSDPVLASLRARGLWLREIKPGTHAVICPWTGEHTRDDPPTSSASAYMMRNFEGRSHDGFRCLHTACAARSLGALLEFLGLRAPPPLTVTEEFEARWNAHPLVAEDEMRAGRSLAEQCGDHLRYCVKIGWLTLAPAATHWTQDANLVHRSDVKVITDAAAATAPPKAQKSLRSRAFANGALWMAEAERNLVCVPEQFDRDPCELNTPQGVFNLRSGDMRAHRADDLFMRCTAVAPSIAPPRRFVQFMSEITGDDPALMRYHQTALGACLFGANAVPGDHWLLFWHGTGRNGKNTLVILVVNVMGGYAKVVPSTVLLLDERGNRHPTEIANLFGARFVMSSEIQEGARWSENQIKSLTGDAMISARFMRQDFFEFRRTHRHVILGNHRPLMSNPDPAMLARMHLVPFNAHFGDDRADPTLPATLASEESGILHWLLEGAATFWEDGRLRRCAAVESATAAYFEAQSTFDHWLAECCDVMADERTPTAALYRSYSAWKESRGEGVSSTTRFSEELGRRFNSDKYVPIGGGKYTRGFVGLRLKVSAISMSEFPDWQR